MAIDIFHVHGKTQVIRVRFENNTASGLTTMGMTPIGRAEAAPTSTILEIALVTKSWCSNDDLDFNLSLATIGDVPHTKSCPFSIQSLRHLPFTNVRQKYAYLEMLPVVMGSEPTGS